MTLLVHTPGEPAGVGPELLAALAQQPCALPRLVIADPELLSARARQVGLPLQCRVTGHPPAAPAPPGVLDVLPVPLPRQVAAGAPSADNAASLLTALRQAVALVRETRGALVTGPLHKATINAAGIRFSGHTEFLAEQCGDATPLMMLVSGDLRIALATTHLPLRAVPDRIRREHLLNCLQILDRDLRARFGFAQPRILVLGLNPHAGEEGHLGDEEQREIEPAVAAARAAGLSVQGPVAADTAFTPERLRGIDAVLSMYHDQGLPVIKHAGFGATVNVTLGLPFLRTSVDHGTAFDLAGSGRADPGSLIAAEQLAIRLLQR